MKRCTYCGKEYAAEASVCPVDGQPLRAVVSPSPTGIGHSKAFFRWKPVSISLIVLAVLYWGAALLNVWLVRSLEPQGETRNVRFLLWGAFWNVVVGALCLAGRRLIKSGGKRRCAGAALALAAALLIVGRNLLMSVLTGQSAYPVLEALLIWPWLIYAIVYALTAIQNQSVAGASPNGGPATPSGNPGVTEGTPSVS